MEDTNNKEKTYEIIQRCHSNENRQLIDRASTFLLMSSILFLGFVYLPPTAKILATVVCALGLIASVIILFTLGASIKELQFWHDAMKKIEEEEQGTFAYMRDTEMSPNIHGWQVWEKGKLAGLWKSSPYLSLFFVIIWIASLVHVRCLS